jgi:hypothetical protein
MSSLDKRNFYLRLSTVEGQTFAKEMGFSYPSEDVEEEEHKDVLTRWACFMHYGLLKEIEQSSKWMTQFLKKTERISAETNSQDFQSLLTIYGVAMLNKIMDSEKLAFVVPYGDDDND